MNLKIFICHLSLFESFVLSDRFRIIKSDIEVDNGDSPPFKPGSNVTLKCQASDTMEHCIWSHKSRGKYQKCTFEWTLTNGNTETKKCYPDDINKRTNFVGNYDQNECFIKLLNINTYDHGEWKCHIQEYVLGPFDSIAAGDAYATIDLRVDIPKRNGMIMITDIFTCLSFMLINTL